MRILPFSYMQESNIPPPPPYVVTTGTIDSVTYKYARMEGSQVLSGGGATVTARGVIWSLSTPTVNLTTKTVNGSGLGTFGSDINVYGQRTWYVRAYATNSNSITSYGATTSFYAPPGPPEPYAFVVLQGGINGEYDTNRFVQITYGFTAYNDGNHYYGLAFSNGADVEQYVESVPSGGGTNSTQLFYPLAQYTQYSYQVRARNATDQGPWYYGPTQYVTTDGVPPQ